MRLSILLVAFLFVSAPVVGAQAAASVDPSGHWHGSVETPSGDLAFDIDLGRAADGSFAGAISVAVQHLSGLPLLEVRVDGRAIHFHARIDQLFDGELSADGRSISGSFRIEGAALPFSLTRTGGAVIPPPVKSARITDTLEGTWTGTLDAEGTPLKVVLTMANQPDGTATGRLVNLAEGGLVLPLSIAQEGTNVTLSTPVLAASFRGVLKAADRELAGTWTEGGTALPVTFSR